MESGTLLHIALLRKTSRAKKRRKILNSKSNTKEKTQRNLPFKRTQEQNFILSGWDSGQFDVKPQTQNFKRHTSVQDDILWPNFRKQSNKIISQRSHIRTSNTSQRPRNYSFRKPQVFKPIINLQPREQNEFILNFKAKTQRRYPNLKICFLEKTGRKNDCKENDQLQGAKLDQKALVSKTMRDWGGHEEQHFQPFTNFINIKSFRARKFYKA